LPRIFSVQSEFCGFEHWLSLRGVGQQIKHTRTLIALAGAKDSHATHE
jgi:hypothetical protein